LKRADKTLGSSLQAAARVFAPASYTEALDGVDLAEVFITSSGSVEFGDERADAFALLDVPGVSVIIERAAGEKCQRCWRVLAEVGTVPGHADLCLRCADAVDHIAVPGRS
jgi:isoleucyl-tRNA synthetase